MPKCVRIGCGKEMKKNPSITNGMYLCNSCKVDDEKAHKNNTEKLNGFFSKL